MNFIRKFGILTCPALFILINFSQLLIAFEICKRRILSIDMPAVANDMTDEDRMIYMSSILSFHSIQMVNDILNLCLTLLYISASLFRCELVGDSSSSLRINPRICTISTNACLFSQSSLFPCTHLNQFRKCAFKAKTRFLNDF